jgi:trigger factor
MSDPKEQDIEAPDETPEEEQEAGPATTVERTGPCECVINIEADADYLRDRYQEELATLQQEAQLPGFRRGRAPIGLVERRMGKALKGDLVASVAGEAYEDALAEHELNVVSQVESPDFEEMSWEPGQPLEFEFRCEVMPDVEIEADQYKELQIEVPNLAVSDELLEGEMERFAQQFATWEKVTGGVDWDDYVEAEVSAPEAGWQERIGFYPRSEAIGPFAVEGIKGVLVGARPGDEVELTGELGEEGTSGREELAPFAGKKVQLTLIVDTVMRRKIPEIDQALAEKLGMSSVEEVQSLVRERLEANLGEQRDNVARQMVMRRLLEEVEFELPASLVERAAEEEQVRLLVQLLRRGVPRQEAEKRAAESAGATRESVVRRLKATFLLGKIADAERILVTESEVDGQIRAFASRQGWREERAKSYMEERGMVRALRRDMREGKTLEFLLENAHVEEIESEKFMERYGRDSAEEQNDEAEAQE